MNSLLAELRSIPGALRRELRLMTLQGPRAREPLKAMLSVLLAVTAATALQLDDLYWAAFSGYMVMRADFSVSVSRGFRRIAGTVGGALVGVLLAPVVASSPLALMLGLFVVSWIGIFQSLTSRHSYAWTFFGITAVLIMTEALASPATVLHIAATRVAEIVVGTSACLVVASLFASVGADTETPRPAIDAGRRDGLGGALREGWLNEHRPLVAHSTRAALAVALLPLIWRWFEIEDFLQTAITSFVVMIVPAAVVHANTHQTLYKRMVHRTLGCLFGSAVAIACLSVVGDNLLPALLTLGAGVWAGHHIQMGDEGVDYLGTQFALGFLITFVQGPGPVTSILPGLERLVGILIGSVMLAGVILIWPLRQDEQRKMPS